MTDWTDQTDEGVGGNMSGDDAAWRELIARYELPATPDPAAAPWPERENLDNRDPSPQVAGQPASGDQASAGGEDPPGPGDAPDADTAGASDTDTPDAGDADTPGAGTPGSGTDSGDRRPGGAGGDRTRVVRPASPLWRPATDAAEDEDDQYVPPPPPPLPSLDPVAKGAWAALFGGPAYLLLATFLGWQVSGLAALAAVTAFVGGFAVVVFRMGDGPSRGDGPDNGAVV